jgi:hypothetical protein
MLRADANATSLTIGQEKLQTPQLEERQTRGARAPKAASDLIATTSFFRSRDAPC